MAAKGKKREASAGDTADDLAPTDEAATVAEVETVSAPAPATVDSNLPIAIVPQERIAFAFRGVLITLHAGVTAHVEPAVLAMLEQLGAPFKRV